MHENNRNPRSPRSPGSSPSTPPGSSRREPWLNPRTPSPYDPRQRTGGGDRWSRVVIRRRAGR